MKEGFRRIVLIFAVLLCWSAMVRSQVHHGGARKTTRNHHRKLHSKNYIAYFNGCAREGDFANAIMENVYTLAKYFVDYRICIYAMDAAADTFAKFNDSKMTVIRQSQQSSREARSPHRTERLAYGRNACLNQTLAQYHHHHSHYRFENRSKMNDEANVIEDLDRIEFNITDFEPLLITLDMDEINAYPFRVGVFEHALALESQWDLLSFNREPYYDFWALRYVKYHNNIMAYGGKNNWWYFTLHKNFGVKVLDVSPERFFPVYSSFNGINVVKMSKIGHCRYSGEQVWPAGEKHKDYVQECEHVNFQNCLVQQNHAQSFILNEKILYINETFPANFSFGHARAELVKIHEKLR